MLFRFTMSAIRIAIALMFLLSMQIFSASARVLPFDDDFNDAHDDGSPVLWRLAGDSVGSGGTRMVEDGSFIVTGSGYAASFANGTESTTDASVEATINFIRPEGFWGFATRASGDGFYWGGIESNGTIYLGDSLSGSTTTYLVESTSFNPIDDDVSLRMDVRDVSNGVELSLYAWGENEMMPLKPQLQFLDVDTRHAQGTLGMFINGGAPASVAVRNYQAAVPEPSTLSLAFFGLLACAGIRRTKRPGRHRAKE